MEKMIDTRIWILDNAILKYPWGSHTAIPDLLGRPPSGDPQAEMWMGAHPKAPSRIEMDGEQIPLNRAIERYPEAILGERTAAAFSRRLPFLFKVLAAAAPLSIQAHPDRRQAATGFQAENRAGIPLDASNRNYRDDNHKPECICALTPFWGLCGFRPVADITALLEAICPRTLSHEIGNLREGRPAEVLKALYASLLTFPASRKRAILDEALENSRRRMDESPVFRWIPALNKAYPDDIAAVSPAILNLFCLTPGQALYLPAGELHAYLDGMGIELMANSDNVLRGGLTAKHIDVGELMKILETTPRTLEKLVPERVSEYEDVYRTPAQEFQLSVISMRTSSEGVRKAVDGVEILLCTEGSVHIGAEGVRKETVLTRGVSVLIPAEVGAYVLRGRGRIYRASVPL
ncbi:MULTISPECIES: mannose-6-phosphate isomerase, class I [Desulfococcus]|jgi:mannose-6-phosphate isomerase|uniref:mannose-6-phosphate isomerase n=1 Tax=Desulfococcus multivorans DSM 2059 TaxID=1121405 RepID=S7TR65_DESML|nr:mannose-6-phosphate isomerase, class I [Desulfococcus multivorans]AQV01203.1 mannose-6-phosphate isomerase, class I [Desulfococcus multivorans]EPR39160.1 mannose-6-phosphate isomerase, class I [Desulfococcus multivorans DSM 2059]MDX9818405.1 mannose-6-phosphate isomerase, class I [Desulfococcus multivorans]SJZ53514.1 mannose-6-phosphate isomerase, type 1 [Desulfococcus multivorans DSM 2059]